MFCPQCGSTQPDELNFCKSCGANLGSVRTALTKPETAEEFKWNRTWLAEAVMTRAEKDRLRGITPEDKRRREIKAGVITASSGVALTLVLAAIMDGIIIGGGVSSAAIAILSRLWIVGLIPIFVGVALVVNGVFVSKGAKALPSDYGIDGNKPEPAPLEFSAGPETNPLPAGGFNVPARTPKPLQKIDEAKKTADLT